jgi:sugar lactone lactonase YvrE
VVVMVVAVGGATAAGLSTAGAQTESEALGAAAAEGVVQTLAGPDYCPSASTPVESSQEVRALAVDDQGRVVFETGPADARSMVVTVDPGDQAERTADGQIPTLDLGIPAPPPPSGAPPAVQQTPAAAGRMVAAAEGGVIVAAGTRLVHRGQEGPTTLAGNLTGDLGGIGQQRRGDGGPAKQARFRSATSLAQDGAGNVYIADHGGPALASATIRFMNRSAKPVTFYPDTPHEVTVEPGRIDTIAGTSDPDASDESEQEEGSSPQAAAFFGNTTLAVDGDRLYVASALNKTSPEATVQLINLGGSEVTAHGQTVQPGGLQTVAGGGNEPSQQLAAAAGIAVTGQDLYVTDPARHRVHHVDAEGFMETFAGAEGLGATVGGFNGNRRPAVGARLNRPYDVAVGPDGDVHISDQHNGQVRVVGADGRIRAGPGAGVARTRQCDPAGSGESAGRPEPGGPASVTTGPQGGVYFALADGHLVKRRDPSGRVTTLAGTTGQGCRLGCAGFGGDGGPADQAKLDTPTALATGPKGGLYVYDGGNARVRYINRTDQPVTVHGATIPPGAIDTVAGTGTPGKNGDGGPALEAQLGRVATPGFADLGTQAALGYGSQIPGSNLGDLAVDADGSIYIAQPRQDPEGGAYRPAAGEDVDPVEAAVRRVNPEGHITSVAGAGAPGPAGECCHNPAALTLGPDGALYVADATTYQLWALNPTNKPLQAHGHTLQPDDAEVLAGTGDPGFTPQADDATESDLLAPAGLARTQDDTLYLAELGIIQGRDPGHYIQTLTPDDGLGLLTGNGQPGFNGDALDPRLTSLNLPTDLAVDSCGNLLVADAGNDRIRRVNLTGPCNPAVDQAPNTANTGSSTTLTIGLLAAIAAAVGLASGWYWRRRTQAGSARR